MRNALLNFEDNMKRVKDLGVLYQDHLGIGASDFDSSDILRSQFVFVTSALDAYIHDITKAGMIEVLKKHRSPTEAFNNFKITLKSSLLGTKGASEWLEEEIQERHSFASFQMPDKIADAVRLFSDIDLWKEITQKMRSSVKKDDIRNVKDRLKFIVMRRHRIVHESDFIVDVSSYHPRPLTPIDYQDTQDAVGFIDEICHHIHEIIEL